MCLLYLNDILLFRLMDNGLRQVKKMCLRIGFGLTLVLGIFNPCFAIEVDNLYQAEVRVKDQSSKLQHQKLVEGMKEVLIRKSGSRRILQAEVVKQSLGKAQTFLQRYHYTSVPVLEQQAYAHLLQANQQQLVGEQSQATNSGELMFPYKLVLDFEPRLIDPLIQQSGLTLWGSNRPLSLLWIALERPVATEVPLESGSGAQPLPSPIQPLLQRQLIKAGETTEPVGLELRAQAQTRGLPIIFPLMDLEDELNVSVSDVWGRFDQVIEQASIRYGADAILVGRVELLQGSWQGKFSYLNQGESYPFDLVALSLDSLLADAIDQLAELLCAKFCVSEVTETNQLTMQVSNVTNFAAFKKLQKYLLSLSSVSHLAVIEVKGHSLLLQLDLLGDGAAIRQNIELNQLLIEQGNPTEPELSQSLQDTSSSANGLRLQSDQDEMTLWIDALAKPTAPANQTLPPVEVGTTRARELTLSGPLTILYYRWQG